MYEKIWLAGLGTYARYEKLGLEGKRLFEELAEDGENVRDRANDKVHELKDKAKDKIKKTIVKLREIVHLEKNDNTQDLSLQIEELSKAVKALSAAEHKIKMPSRTTVTTKKAS